MKVERLVRTDWNNNEMGGSVTDDDSYPFNKADELGLSVMVAFDRQQRRDSNDWRRANYASGSRRKSGKRARRSKTQKKFEDESV